MTTTRHSGSVQIDAPVETVFEYVKDPAHFYGAMPARMRPGRPAESGAQAVHLTPEGVGTTYEWVAGHIAGFKLVGVMTRDQYVVNERIVDRSSTGPVWTWTVEPEGEGTRLTLVFEYSSKVPASPRSSTSSAGGATPTSRTSWPPSGRRSRLESGPR